MNDKKSKWRIEYDNDTGPADGGFCEWWDITDGDKVFRCFSKSDAEWLFRCVDLATFESL